MSPYCYNAGFRLKWGFGEISSCTQTNAGKMQMGLRKKCWKIKGEDLKKNKPAGQAPPRYLGVVCADRMFIMGCIALRVRDSGNVHSDPRRPHDRAPHLGAPLPLGATLFWSTLSVDSHSLAQPHSAHESHFKGCFHLGQMFVTCLLRLLAIAV